MGFKCPKIEDIFQKHMKGLSDNRLSDFELMYPDSFLHVYGNEKVNALCLYADSFIKCAESMYLQYKRKDITIVWSFSTVIPVLYNCRHAVELLIKALYVQLYNEVKDGHKLLKIWQDCKIEDKELDNFVHLMSEIDSDGTILRYPFDKDRSGRDGIIHYRIEQTWANVGLIMDTTKNFQKEITTLIKKK